MQLLSRYSKKYSKQFGTAVGFVIVEALCDLMQPTRMSKIIDKGVAEQQMGIIKFY